MIGTTDPSNIPFFHPVRWLEDGARIALLQNGELPDQQQLRILDAKSGETKAVLRLGDLKYDLFAYSPTEQYLTNGASSRG
jgi:hypothetical protein